MPDLAYDDFDAYLPAIRDTLANARRRALVVSPFIDEAGVRFLEEAWPARLHKASRLRIYVRKVGRALSAAAERQNWELFTYRQSAPPPHEFGFHAKIFANEARVVVGSLNLVRSNMFQNLEVGSLTDDEAARVAVQRLEARLEEASVRLL